MRSTRIAAAALASAALVAGAAGVAGATVAGHHTGDGSTAPTSHQSRQVVSPNTVDLAPHDLTGTYFSRGSRSGATVAAGFQTVDDVTTFKCAKACHLEADENVQQLSSATGNKTALTIRVDGVDQTAPYVGLAPTTFGASAWTTVTDRLSKGTHTVQTVIFTDQGTNLYNYSNVYRVYQP